MFQQQNTGPLMSGSFMPSSMNNNGSLPTLSADSNFEPNFRQFDLFLDNKETPDANLVERVYKSPEGEAHWDLNSFLSTNIRCTPVVVTSLFGAAFCNFLYTRFLNRTAASIRWSFLKFYVTILAWNNFTKFYARERYFQRDFQRNQMYSYEERRYQREQQRVREALYETQFVTNPVAEYRIKAWQVADRFA
ncbi:hypothetical protein AGDE_00564 [Angomonas deanei]|uniref:Uncharacterized protein n=1 Tax=Angomonas deanei TaxID=59799 RepID=S9U6D9_9TRYP|nr:hypothetical protein AGDE_12397 [Angomonas deanei]EPY26804.1 hypothetical protein AGDE_11083 [Angomonas deanei]EPY43357.1 hypothetical protein AGDE_00564 [Angomonas deanei]CAD2213286.1 hypothetical protein, conserved [Angomonas deanei]|eukprot:EPY24339.1 hypothetical protein AGDE_12397 [Angomonas deanei]